jgi:SEC-C motif-containing protein
MGKQGKIKNGNNKAKHTKLLNQKKAKIREAKVLNKERLKAIIAKKNKLEQSCPCGSEKTYEVCCYIGHTAIEDIETAEQLMRSRYSAYVMADIDYLMKSHHSTTCPNDEKEDILKWTKAVEWIRLDVLNSSKGLKTDIEGTVEFKAFFKEKGDISVIHENSKFIKENKYWVYLGET